ncbi:MAG TPA: hypothetical protein VN836_09195 [Verrucomicrobiae bacterium]|nr:hypothetical protein [Verrucomicrobiae bacterium]
MKQTSTNENRGNGSSPWNACKALCRKAKEELAAVKEAILAESSRALQAPERLVRLALNEAEAAAWQTGYPHLVFPALATEKIQAVAVWNAHQRFLRHDATETAFVA